MVSPRVVRDRVKNGYGEMLSEQRAVNQLFRTNETTETAPLARRVDTLEDITKHLGLDRGTEQEVQKLIRDTPVAFDLKTQTQRIFLARAKVVQALRAWPHIAAEVRMEIVKRTLAFWQKNERTDYGLSPTVRWVARKSEPTLVVQTDGLCKSAKPPKGYSPVRNSKRGGYSKMVGGKRHYWYPPKGGAQRQSQNRDPFGYGGPVQPHHTLAEAEDAIKGEPIEHLVVFNGKGEQIWRQRGTKNKVQLPDHVLEAMNRDKTTVYTHNHPNGSILSPSDLVMSMYCDVAEARAVSPDGRVFRIKRPPDGWPHKGNRDLYLGGPLWNLDAMFRKAGSIAARFANIETDRYLQEQDPTKPLDARHPAWSDELWRTILTKHYLERYNEAGARYGLQVEQIEAGEEKEADQGTGLQPAGIPDRRHDAEVPRGTQFGFDFGKARYVVTLSKAGARGGKYLRRVPYMKDGKRRYRYYYRQSAVARDAKAGESIRFGDILAEVLGVAENGDITLKINKSTITVNPFEWNAIVAKHYGERYYAWAEKRSVQSVNAVLRHVPRELLTDLTGSDAERLAQLKERVPKVYEKLQASFQRSGINPYRAKHVLETVLARRSWMPEARAAVIGQVIEHKDMGYRQTVQVAENLAGGGSVQAGHVQAAYDMRKPRGKTPRQAATDVATQAEAELAKLSAAMARARKGGPKEQAAVLAQALNSPAMAQLMQLAQGMPGLQDKAVQPVRDALLEVPAHAPRKAPTREGAEGVVYVSGENGQPKALKTRYKLMEASEVIASHQPGTFSKHAQYPAGVQERAYHRDKDEQAKVLRNAHKMNPAFLINTNPDAVNGPPILDQTGIVLGGNSRAMSMQLAYEKHPESAKTMRDYLVAHAHEVGFTAEDIGALKNPILVREVMSEGKDSQKLLVRQMNESFTQGMDPRTMQVAMGRKLDDAAVKTLGDSMEADETLSGFLDSKRAEGFINALTRTGIIDQRNSNQYMVKGTKRLNEDGKRLVEGVLVGRMVGDADILANTGTRLVGNIARSVPFMTQAKSYGAGYDVGPDLKVALEAYNDLHYRAQQGHRAALSPDMSDAEFKALYNQDEMFGDPSPVTKNPRAMAMLEVLIRKNGPQKMAAVFRDYAARAAQHPEDQESMFGAAPSPSELFQDVVKASLAKSFRYVTQRHEPTLVIRKGGPYIGPKGGKWADPKLTIPYKEKKEHPGQKRMTREQSIAWFREAVERAEAMPKNRGSRTHSIHFEGKRLNVVQARKLLDTLPRKETEGAKPTKADAKKEKIALAEVTEGKVTFKTGQPVTLDYVRNTGAAPKAGSEDRFQQKIEPAGRYISHVAKEHWGPEQPGQTRGSLTFKKPLVLHLNTGGPDAPIYDENSWKARLQEAYGGKKGKALSNALAKDGFDGIVTVETTKRGSHTAEIVDLRFLHTGALEKGGPYIGPRGGKWADPKRTIPWSDEGAKGKKYKLTVKRHPKIFGGQSQEYEVEHSGEGKVRVGRAEMPIESLSHFLNDQEGKVDVPKHPDRAEINAVIEGVAKVLGKGDDGIAFRVGDKVVKVSTTVPFVPDNPGHRSPAKAIDMLENQVKVGNKLADLGVPGIQRSEYVKHGDKGFQIKPYVEIPEKWSKEQLDKVQDILIAMHKKGYALNDDVQPGIDAKGEPVMFDIGKAAPIPDNDEASGVYSAVKGDMDNLKRLYQDHGETFVRRDVDEGQQAWDKIYNRLDELAKKPNPSEGFVHRLLGMAADKRREIARASLSGQRLKDKLESIDTEEEWARAEFAGAVKHFAEKAQKSFAPKLIVKGGPYIGPRGGRYANPQRTIPYKEPDYVGTLDRAMDMVRNKADQAKVLKYIESQGFKGENAKRIARKAFNHSGYFNSPEYKQNRAAAQPSQPAPYTPPLTPPKEAPKVDTAGLLVGNLGIKRLAMPQIRSDLVPDFMAQLKARGIDVGHGRRAAAELRATQSSLNVEKVQGMIDSPDMDMNALTKPIIVSQDGYIMDGHHRWAALRTIDPKAQIPTIEVGLPMRDLLVAAYSYSDVEFKKSSHLHGYRPNIEQQAGASPIRQAPEVPDFQAIYTQPESTAKQKREREQQENRRKANAKRNRGTYGFHGTPNRLKPELRWDVTEDPLAHVRMLEPNRPGKREPRLPPKLVVPSKAAQPATAEESTKDEKRKRKKKKKKAKLAVGQ